MRKLIFGNNNFVADTPWGGWSAFFVAIGFFLLQMAVVFAVLFGLAFAFAGTDIIVNLQSSPENMRQFIDYAIIATMMSYLVTFSFVLFIGNRRGGNFRNVVLFKKPVNLWVNLLFSIVVLGLFFVLLSFVIETFFEMDAKQSEAQMKQIFDAIKGSHLLWGGVAVIVIGAPFLEEAIFRGFLLTSFANTRLGFWGGAVLSSALWAAIHGYAPSMSVGLFLFGLILSLLVRRTGSIWVSIFMHMLWNGTVTVGMFAVMNAS